MNLRRLVPVGFALLSLALSASACEVEVPPATPANPPSTDVPPPGPPIASGDTSAQGGDGTLYASGEYAIGADSDTYDDNDPAALTDFHGALDSHGTWADDPKYGTVWAPSAAEVGPDFTPYSTAGHWVMGDGDEYVWVSDYDWGWAPFHYGRWVLADGRGWVWVPGRVYRGAWVEWGWDDGYGYVGWYPMMPTWYWYGGVAVVAPFYVGPRWVYCGRGDVFSPVVGTRVIAGPAVAGIAARVHVAAHPGLGPAPARLGYAPTQVPHVSGTAAASLAHAQQFGRPSTAAPLGAAPHVASTTPMGRGMPAGSAPMHPGGAIPAQPSALSRRRVEPDTTGLPKRSTSGGTFHGPTVGTPTPSTPTFHPAPSAPTFHGGGTGGGHGGGGGHHR